MYACRCCRGASQVHPSVRVHALNDRLVTLSTRTRLRVQRAQTIQPASRTHAMPPMDGDREATDSTPHSDPSDVTTATAGHSMDDGTCTEPLSSPAPLDDSAWSLSCLHPLRDFFPRADLSRPSLRLVSPEEIPEPSRSLLVHTHNMTPTLAEFWCQQPVALRVVDKEEDRAADVLRRWIILEVPNNTHKPIDGNAAPHSTSDVQSSSLAANAVAAVAASSSRPPPTPVEFASIRISLHNLPSSLHSTVWSGSIPFHTALRQHDPPLEQTVEVRLFFQVAWSDGLSRALGLAEPTSAHTHVYGRCNTMRDMQGRTICEVVEIVPPMW